MKKREKARLNEELKATTKHDAIEERMVRLLFSQSQQVRDIREAQWAKWYEQRKIIT